MPWIIAALQFRLADGRLVDVEHAADDEFQQLVDASGIVVDANGIVEWSFDDRIRFIDHCTLYGVTLPFVGLENKKDSGEEQKEVAEPAREGK